ncbi:O-succinylhomoserine sulfhydrylase [Haliea sp.]|jgi:O-succinylhomoserine sulfhydrylase|uniref:O-succinylhomoserine sulfhydrylase n=1 Tax=Haliea TaxID=475794 RepID=UPI000C373BB0|nr:O-succinylhomoserine sulfhydrylase [Haliea sp.]MAD64514.1 O-succinylhomoserine sulfhydrylase [Haliea sp.]MAY91795.1 O-succinylhomoserine sulfhydrylase [Haliea sp.]MBP70521.1 O-succinylhomoserine sulfhydrylase [Haliea sp.]HCD55735.1 O-succinylhomoserine sulfhydrylase [Halieaceae bacterium]|tara:strand:+ start:3015 stop:4211 length:1197 start_codon:yes stop_codon:yes gene_type:complete
MNDSNDPLAGAGLDTLAIRAGIHRTAEGEHSEPIFATSSYVFDSAADAAARFAGEAPGNVYSRYTNPTVRSFEERLAALEGGEAAVGTASGMAAILSTCMALLKAGDHVICSRDVFGTTTNLFARYMTRFGVSVDFVPLLATDEWRAALRPETRLLYLETPSNPLCEVADIRALADLAHAQGALLVVDNCFCTPALQRPLALGADIVIHSATKYLDGQGRCVGGAVVGSQALMDEVVVFLRTCGPTMSAFNAWVFLKGLETLRLRMEAHSRAALELALWLQQQPQVQRVYYAGLPEHPGHALAASQQTAFGGVLSFEVRGGQAAAWRCIDATQILSLTANLGDAKTTIVHPATTTHGRLSAQQRADAGISDGLIRVAVGLEDVADLRRDLQRGLSAAG